MPIVRLPDGTEIEFVEGMSAAEINAALMPLTPAGKLIGNIRDPVFLRPYKEIARPYVKLADELIKDMIPGLSQSRSVDRIKSIMDESENRSTIGKILSGADVGLEAIGMGADIVPMLKGAGVALGSLFPLMARNVDDALPGLLRSQKGSIGHPNKPLERARRQGFDLDTVFFHGTSGDFDTFDLSKGGSVTESPAAKGVVFATSNKRKAQEFADLAASKTGKKPNVVEMFVQNDKIAKLNFKEATGLDMRSANGQRVLAGIIEDAREQGLEGLRILGDDGVSGGNSEILVVMDPAKLRRIDAKFSDSDFGRNGLLLGGAGLGASVLASEAIDAGENNTR